MKPHLVLAMFFCALPLQVTAGNFCCGSKITTLDKVLSNPKTFLNKRVQVQATLRTDGKAYTRIASGANPETSILTTADAESTTYSKRHHLSNTPLFDVRKDLFDKLHALEGSKYKRDLSKIRYYRQEVTVCGRLVLSNGTFRFAIDNLRVESSYLLPWKKSQKGEKRLEFKSFVNQGNTDP